MFRLINFITGCMLPFVMPDVFPKEKIDILNRIKNSYKTEYEIFLYDTSLYIRPNFLIKKFLRMNIPEINVKN